MRQRQFLEVIDRDEAERRWRAALALSELEIERIPLAEALGRVLAEDVRAEVDVPGFDRANMDGFALRAEDTFGATESEPVRLRVNPERLPTGIVPKLEVGPGTATSIATGAMLPRGADAVVPVEDTELDPAAGEVVVRRAVAPGNAVSFAGSDIGRGETVLFAGTGLTARETGVLAAIGMAQIPVRRRPRVAILSTGDEIVEPGAPMRPGRVYDSNATMLADSVRGLGGEPWLLGIFRDDEAALRAALSQALGGADLVLLSGGTSKGEGDLCARVVGELDPGIVVHGVALKPGKPLCLAAHRGKPVAVLPGFPTSALFTFHELVAPVLDRMLGRSRPSREPIAARLAVRVRSERGRLEYLLVNLVARDDGALAAYPMGKGSGSVTTFGRADGFVRIGRQTELLEAGAAVEVVPLAAHIAPADLVVIGSHCVGLDRLLGRLVQRGYRVKVLAVGSQAGLAAARRGECDLAPIHLFDPETGRYNEPFLGPGQRLLRGYLRTQGLVTRADDVRSLDELLADPKARMVNRNRGSGTRALIEELLAGRRPPGYASEVRTHHAVVAAVAQGRADWGVAIETVARREGLRFVPLREERYDFVVPATRWERPAVVALRELLAPGSALRRELEELGLRTGPPPEGARPGEGAG